MRKEKKTSKSNVCCEMSKSSQDGGLSELVLPSINRPLHRNCFGSWIFHFLRIKTFT